MLCLLSKYIILKSLFTLLLSCSSIIMSAKAQADDIDGRGYRSTHSKPNPQGPTKSPPPVLMPCPIPATAPTRPLVQAAQPSSLQIIDTKNYQKQSLAAKYTNQSHSTAFQPFHHQKALSPISHSPHETSRPLASKTGPTSAKDPSPETVEPIPTTQSQKDSRQMHFTPPESTIQNSPPQDNGYTRTNLISSDIHHAVMRQNELLRQQLELLKLENHKFKDRQVALEQHIMSNRPWQRPPQDQWRTSGSRGPQVRRSMVNRSRSWGPEDPRSNAAYHETPNPRYPPMTTQLQDEHDLEVEGEVEVEERPDRRSNNSGDSTARRATSKGKSRRDPTASLSDSIAQLHRAVYENPVMSPTQDNRPPSRHHRSKSQPRVSEHPSLENYALDDGWYQPEIRHQWHTQDYKVVDPRGEYVTYGDDQYYSGDEEEYYYSNCGPLPRKSSGQWSTRQQQPIPVSTEPLRRVRSSQSTAMPRERHARQPVYQQQEVFVGPVPRQIYRVSPAVMSPGVKGSYTEYRRPVYPAQYIRRAPSRGRSVYPPDFEPARSYSSYGPIS
ncbi:hypothetical protein CLU79DRAFT_438582 [Phycomyces nitens]|nr:hypothetical protein CLU79DRAFT_438582 [Phycomyces nitens]